MHKVFYIKKTFSNVEKVVFVQNLNLKISSFNFNIHHMISKESIKGKRQVTDTFKSFKCFNLYK